MRHNSSRTAITIFYFILSLRFINSVWTSTDSTDSTDSKVPNASITAKVSLNYLRSFPIVSAPSKILPPKTKRRSLLQKDKLQLAESTQRKVILRTIFSDIDANIPGHNEAILNTNAWTDLILFCGGSSNPTYHFLSRINRTTTVLGECALGTLLVTPTSDITILSNRQQTIQVLLEDPTCFKTLKQSLIRYQKAEQRLLSLWTHTDPLYTDAYKNYMNKRFLSTNSATNKIASKLNLRIFFQKPFRYIWRVYYSPPIRDILV